ncbi:hypothetical protein AB0J74_12070 [Asanoa sp. NPDC049573]|uniref:hypothetical protein n=1 Tax=Asanoa sp. NPDC049573 TaxID=3155396 RepID=UPI003434C5C2
MTKKFLGKVLASVALGGATLLIAPGIALADDGQGADWAHAQDGKDWSHCASSWGDEAKKDEAKKDGYKKDEDKKDEKGSGKPEGKPESAGKPEAAKGAPGGEECEAPKGWVDGGDAGSTVDGKLATSGGILLAGAALGGVVLMRRRRTDGSLA